MKEARDLPSAPSYIVTGGAGFVGSNLAAALARREPGSTVVVVDDFRTGSFANIVEAHERLGLPPFAGEVLAEPTGGLDFAGLLDAARPAAVFHLAAITDTTVADERTMLQVNVGGFGAMLRACADARVPLVYASSAATYGSPAEAERRIPFAVETAGRPNNVYGFSKWLMECEHTRLARERASGGGDAPWAVGLRYFNVFGPGESQKGKMASMACQLAGQMLAGGCPRLFVDGSQARDQVYVDDVVSCTMAAAGLGERAGGARPTPGVYNLGSGRATSFNEMAEAVRTALGLSAAARPTEYFEMPPSVRRFYQDYTCADMRETRRGLGWSPSHDPLEAAGRYARYLQGRAGR